MLSQPAASPGAPLRALRRARGWSQAELARRAGVPRSTIVRLERRGGGSLPTLRRLAAALGAPITALMPTDAALASAQWMEAPAAAGPLPVGNWSPSRLLDWLHCPARGAWSTGVLELPADFHWPERPAAVRGRAVHAYVRARLAGGDVDEARIAGADATYATGLDPEAWLPFADAWEARIRPQIGAARAVEQRLEAEVDGLRVTCVIDVVDEAGAIRDLKTAQRAPDAWATARESLQAVLYPLAWRQRTGEDATFQLDVLVARKRGAEAVSIPVPVTDAAVDRVRRQLAWAQAQAEAGLADPDRIIPNPMTRYGCRECPFLALCAERYGFPALPAPAEPVAAEA